MPSPAVQVKDGAGSFAPTTGGNDVTPGNTITVDLIDKGVNSWEVQCLTTDEISDPATVNAEIALTLNPTTKQFTFVAPVRGRTYRFQSRVDGGNDANGRAKASYTTTFCVYVPHTSGDRCVAADETTEGGADDGWGVAFNRIVRRQTTKSVGSIYQEIGTGQTAAASTTTMYSFTMSDERCTTVAFDVTMARRTNVTKAAHYKGYVTYRRTGGGAPAIVGAAVYDTDQETTAGDDVTLDVSGNDIRVRLTSADADPRNWLGKIDVVDVNAT